MPFRTPSSVRVGGLAAALALGACAGSGSLGMGMEYLLNFGAD